MALIPYHRNTENAISVQFYNKMYQQKGDSIKFVYVIIDVAVYKINKMADCRVSRLERNPGNALFLFSSNDSRL